MKQEAKLNNFFHINATPKVETGPNTNICIYNIIIM